MWNNVGLLIGETFNIPDEQAKDPKIKKQYQKYIKRSFNSKKAPYHTSIDIYGKECFNLLAGVFYAISQGMDKYTVNVRVSSNLLLRYGNLLNVYGTMGSAVDTDEYLGEADGYVTFEYCTNKPSKFPVRVNGDVYYKQDPTSFLIEDRTPEILAYSYDYLGFKFDPDDEEETYSDDPETGDPTQHYLYGDTEIYETFVDY